MSGGRGEMRCGMEKDLDGDDEGERLKDYGN